MAPVTKKNSRPIFKTSSPFTETKWPQILHEDQEIIIDLVCNLLTPLGDHRKTHIHPSKGKKRKRTTPSTETTTAVASPSLQPYILIGLNSITRHLEARTTPPPQPSKSPPPLENPLSLILITTPHPPSSPLYTHLPTLIHLANLPLSSSSPSSPQPTLLIPLPSSTDALFAKTLHIPRVGALGIHAGAPGARALEDFVRERVGVTECAWLEEAGKGVWRGVEVGVKG